MPNSTPIMMLPPELHLAIAKRLNFPDNVMLKLSSRYFHKTIDRLSFEQLVDGWWGEPDKFFDFQPCYDCHRVRPEEEFEGRRERSCIECNFQQQREGYRIGDLINVDRGHVLCGQCAEFNGDIPRRVEGLCQECWGRFERQGHHLSLEHTSKLKTSVAWLHHGIRCAECRKLLDRCQRVLWKLQTGTTKTQDSRVQRHVNGGIQGKAYNHRQARGSASLEAEEAMELNWLPIGCELIVIRFAELAQRRSYALTLLNTGYFREDPN